MTPDFVSKYDCTSNLLTISSLAGLALQQYYVIFDALW